MTETTIRPGADWQTAAEYTEILYHKAEGIAKITINRPHVRNAFTPTTVKEMMHAFNDARDDVQTGVIVITGAGDLAFCSGGDQTVRGESGYKDARPDTSDSTCSTSSG